MLFKHSNPNRTVIVPVMAKNDGSASIDSAMTNTSQTSHDSRYTNWLEHLQRLLRLADNQDLNQPTFQGLTTGLPTLDAMTGGLPKGEISVVAHNGSLRSNWLIWNLALNAAKQQPKPVLIWTQRWKPVSVTSALAGLHCGLSSYDLKLGRLTETQWEAIAAKLTSLEVLPLHLVTDHAKTAADLACGIKKLTQKWGEPAMVVIPDLADLHRPDPGYGGSACHHHAQQLLDAVQDSETCLLLGCTTRASAVRRADVDFPSYNDISSWPEIISDAALILMPIWHKYWRNAHTEHFSQTLLYGKGRHHGDIYNCRANDVGLYWEEPDSPL